MLIVALMDEVGKLRSSVELMPRYEVPVVRTEGKVGDGGVALTLELLLERGSLLIVSSSSRTRAAEVALGLDESVYFYAGRACPTFGDMVFAFKPEATQGWKGTAMPFDSGGIFRDDQGRRYIFPDGVPPPGGGADVGADVHSNDAARAYVDYHKCASTSGRRDFVIQLLVILTARWRTISPERRPPGMILPAAIIIRRTKRSKAAFAGAPGRGSCRSHMT